MVKEREVGRDNTLPACAKTYTQHPNTDLNAHIWKYRYIYLFFTHPTVYREIIEIPIIIITTPTLHSKSKEPKSAI